MLVNPLCLLDAVKQEGASRNFVTRSTQIVLPLSPNHGLFGNVGLYSKSRIPLEILFVFGELGRVSWPCQRRYWGKPFPPYIISKCALILANTAGLETWASCWHQMLPHGTSKVTVFAHTLPKKWHPSSPPVQRRTGRAPLG